MKSHRACERKVHLGINLEISEKSRSQLISLLLYSLTYGSPCAPYQTEDVVAEAIEGRALMKKEKE